MPSNENKIVIKPDKSMVIEEIVDVFYMGNYIFTFTSENKRIINIYNKVLELVNWYIGILCL